MTMTSSFDEFNLILSKTLRLATATLTATRWRSVDVAFTSSLAPIWAASRRSHAWWPLSSCWLRSGRCSSNSSLLVTVKIDNMFPLISIMLRSDRLFPPRLCDCDRSTQSMCAWGLRTHSLLVNQRSTSSSAKRRQCFIVQRDG